MLALLLAANSTGDNQTHLCIEAACAVRSSEGWYILALYMTVGAFVFCSALCCGAWADCDEANSSDLIVISGLGKDVLRRVPLHAIRLEDFVYLLPSLRKSSTVRSSQCRTLKSKPALKSSLSVDTPTSTRGLLMKKSQIGVPSLKVNAKMEPFSVNLQESQKSVKSELSISTGVGSKQNAVKLKSKGNLKPKMAKIKKKTTEERHPNSSN